MDKFHYKILREIGKGSFGRVYKARKVRSDYAIKKVRCDAPENVELALQEFWTLSCLKSHENIIRFEECYLQHGNEIRPMKHGDKSSPSYMYLVEMAIKGKRGWDQAQYHLWFVMEYCNCGDMNDYILDRDPIPYLNTIFMKQLAGGISFLHKSNVVHRDLKPENVLVRFWKGRDPILKIADFGLSKVCNHPIKDADNNEEDSINVDTCWLSSACGSDFFMAPEVFEGRYTAKADVFALGIMFWAIMDRITFIDAGTKKVLLGTYVRRNKEVLPVGEALLDDPNLDMTQLLVDTGQGPVPGQRSKRSHSRSCVAGNKKKLRDLIAQMVHPNPEFRPSSQELLGRLELILQPNERPKGLRLNIKKTELAKNDFNRLKMDSADETINKDLLHNEHCRKNVQNGNLLDQRIQSISCTDIEKDEDSLQNEELLENSRPQLNDKRRRKLRRRNIPIESNHSDRSEERKAVAGKTAATVAKARRKALAAVKKRKLERTVTRNLRSTKNARRLAGGVEEQSNEQKVDLTQFLPNFIAEKQSERSNNSTESQLPSQDVDLVSALSESTRKSNQRNLGSHSKFEDPQISPSKQQADSDDGADFLLDDDVDSRDSSIASEIPEFDSGYKSKRSRRVSHISGQAEDSMTRSNSDHSPCDDKCLVDVDEKTSNSYTSKETKGYGLSSFVTYGTCVTNKVSKSPSQYHWRHNGLKEQIRACKANADIEHRREARMLKNPRDSSVPQYTVNGSEQEIAAKAPVTSLKPKLEVPRTPCVVMQSKAKTRHNPFQTAVKKRWKYVVLDEFPSPPETTSSATMKNEEDVTTGSSARTLGLAKSSKFLSQTSVTVKMTDENRHKVVKNCPPELAGATTVEDSSKFKTRQQKIPKPTAAHTSPLPTCNALSSAQSVLQTSKPFGHSGPEMNLNKYRTSPKAEKVDKHGFRSSKKHLGYTFAPQDLEFKSKEKSDSHTVLLHQANNSQRQMLQHLSSYWYPGKGIRSADHKLVQTHLDQELALLRPKRPSHSCISSSSRHLSDAARHKTSEIMVHSKASARNPTIPTIDLTQDGEFVPPCKKQRCAEDRYSSAHKRGDFVIHPKRFHHTFDPLSLQTYEMSSQRHPDIFQLPHTISDSAGYRNAQLDFQRSLQMNSSTDLLHNSLLSPLGDSSIDYMSYGRVQNGFCSPTTRSTFDRTNMPAIAFTSYSDSSPEGCSNNHCRSSDLKTTVELPRPFLRQPHIINSSRGVMMPGVSQNLMLTEGLNGTVPQQMRRNLYSSSPLTRRPASGLVTQYDGEGSNFCSVGSNMLTLTGYPCHLQHSKPILNN